MSKKYIITLPFIAILLIISIAIGYSYALFSQTEVQETPNIVTSGCFSLSLEEDDYDIALTNSYPMSDAEGLAQKAYSFTITNTCTVDAAYVVTLNPLVDGTTIDLSKVKVNVTGEDDNKAQPILETTILNNLLNDSTNKDEASSAAKIIAKGDLAAASAKNATDGASQKFNVRFWIKSDAGNEVTGQTMAAKMVVRSEAVALSWEKTCSQTESDLFNCQIIENEGGIVAISAKTDPDFSISPATDDGLYVTPDEDGNSYYFRGAVTDNYVSFLNYYWRIIRINGDGSIRLIFDGKITDVGASAYANNVNDSQNKFTSIGNSTFNLLANEAKYAGWTYDNQSTVEVSAIKSYLNEWYSGVDSNGIATTKFTYPRSSMKSYAINLNPVNICNDTSGTISDRLSSGQPSLICPENQNADFGGDYTNSVGLITADEMVLAGVNKTWTTNNSYLNRGYSFWSITPTTFESEAKVYSLPGYSEDNLTVNLSRPVRPVISIAKNSVINNGVGTASDPYYIDPIH